MGKPEDPSWTLEPQKCQEYPYLEKWANELKCLLTTKEFISMSN